MKFIITKELHADNIAEAFSREKQGQGEVVEIYKAKDQPQQPATKLDVGFKTSKQCPKRA